MEYVHQRGSFDDMPLAQMTADFATTYPKLEGGEDLRQADFLADVERENP